MPFSSDIYLLVLNFNIVIIFWPIIIFNNDWWQILKYKDLCLCKYKCFKIITIHSNLSSSDVGIGSISPIQIFYILLIIVKRFIALSDILWFLSRLDPGFFFAVVCHMMFTTVMIVVILLALALSAFVRVSPVLPQLFNTLHLFLLSLELFLLLLNLFLPLLLFSLFLFLLLLHGRWCRGIHIHELTVFIQSSLGIFSTFLLSDLFVQSLSIFFDWKFCILINWDFNHTIILNLLLRIVKIFHVRMFQSFLYCNTVVWIEDQHFFQEIKGVLVHVWEKWVKRSFLDKWDLIQTLLSHNRLHGVYLLSWRFSQELKYPFNLI